MEPSATTTAPATAVGAPPPRDTESLCAAAQNSQVDEEIAFAAAGDTPKFKYGDARRYYYGIGTPVDYVRARQAAFWERKNGKGAFAAMTVLMMLYANGQGVAQNLDYALKLACESPDSQARAELDGRVLHLATMKTSPKLPPFDFCEDVSGGDMEGYCAALAEARSSAQRKSAVDSLARGWPAEQRASLAKLQAALETFAQTTAAKEWDHSAADSETATAEAVAEVRQSFTEALQRFEQGKFPEGTAAEYKMADEELNRVYKVALKKDFSDSSISAAGIKATEKTWIAYRDAWLALTTQRYPQVPSDAFKTWLTAARAERLQRL